MKAGSNRDNVSVGTGHLTNFHAFRAFDFRIVLHPATRFRGYSVDGQLGTFLMA